MGAELVFKALGRETKALIIVSEFEARRLTIEQMREVLRGIIASEDERRAVLTLVENDLRATGYHPNSIVAFLQQLTQEDEAEPPADLHQTRRLRSPFVQALEPQAPSPSASGSVPVMVPGAASAGALPGTVVGIPFGLATPVQVPAQAPVPPSAAFPQYVVPPPVPVAPAAYPPPSSGLTGVLAAPAVSLPPLPPVPGSPVAAVPLVPASPISHLPPVPVSPVTALPPAPAATATPSAGAPSTGGPTRSRTVIFPPLSASGTAVHPPPQGLRVAQTGAPTDLPRPKVPIADAARQTPPLTALPPPPAAPRMPSGATNILFGAPPKSVHVAERPKVLLADDDMRIRIVFRMTLERLGLTVVEASDGNEAWRRIQDGGFSLVVLDMKMPGLHGLEVISRMSGHQINIPVIICSAYDQLKDEFVVATHPQLRYLVKPVASEALEKAARELLGLAVK